jgi:tellurium resistance protein TerD
MASFNLQKGGKFQIAKGISKVLIGLGWDVKPGKACDVDAHAFGCIADANGNPKFYNDASHALTYANKSSLKKNSNGSFQTLDGTMLHSGDDRTGGSSAAGDDEKITIDLDKIPADIVEISAWVTIYEPGNGTFGMVENSYVRLVNEDSGVELCRYNLKNEFATDHAIQVGSLFRKDGEWTFQAIGAGLADKGLEDILAKLS